MDVAYLHDQIELFLKENLSIIILMGKEYANGLMGESIMATGYCF